MKTNLSHRAALIAALVIAATASSYAGPSSQYWTQQAGNSKASSTTTNPSAAAPAKPADPAAMACPNCNTRVVEEFVATNGAGRFSPHYSVIGREHTCATCGGDIKTVQGKTTNNMTSNCPICAKAVPACCKLSG